jgi:hypothetical protein
VEALGIDRGKDGHVPLAELLDAGIGMGQSLPRRDDAVGQPGDHRHRHPAQRRRGASVVEVPDNRHALEVPGDRGMRIRVPVDLDEVDASSANQLPERTNLGSKAGHEAHLGARVERRPQPVQRDRHRLHSLLPETAGGIAFRRDNHGRLPTAALERRPQLDELVKAAAEDRAMHHPEQPPRP